MNARDTEGAFQALLPQVAACQEQRRTESKKLDGLSGDVKIKLRINPDGSVKSAYLPETTLADLPTEACIVKTAMAASFPRPVGGEGDAESSFQLAVRGSREPATWSWERIEKAMKKPYWKFVSCRQGKKGPFHVTMFIDGAGRVASAGVAPPEPGLDSVLECMVKQAKLLRFSPGGRSGAKVSFTVR